MFKNIVNDIMSFLNRHLTNEMAQNQNKTSVKKVVQIYKILIT